MWKIDNALYFEAGSRVFDSFFDYASTQALLFDARVKYSHTEFDDENFC